MGAADLERQGNWTSSQAFEKPPLFRGRRRIAHACYPVRYRVRLPKSGSGSAQAMGRAASSAFDLSRSLPLACIDDAIEASKVR